MSHCVKPATAPRGADPSEALDAAERRRSGGGGGGATTAVVRKHSGRGVVLVVPDLAAVVGQMAALGEGLVAGVLVAPATLPHQPQMVRPGAQDSD